MKINVCFSNAVTVEVPDKFNTMAEPFCNPDIYDPLEKELIGILNDIYRIYNIDLIFRTEDGREMAEY